MDLVGGKQDKTSDNIVLNLHNRGYSMLRDFGLVYGKKPCFECSVSWMTCSPHERQRELAVAAMQSTAPLQKSKQDIAPSMLLHSLYLVFVQAGMVGLTAQEAAAEITQKNLPGLKEKSAKIGPHSVQVAKAIRASPEFTDVDEFGKYALRRSLLKAFRQGTLEPTSYFEQKRLEASLLEKYTL